MSVRRFARLFILTVPLLVGNGRPLLAAGDVPLIDAIRRWDLAGARSLLKQGVDVNAAEADKATALAWAVHRNDAELADLLIRGGADVNAANVYGVTPLHLAALNGNAKVVERLLQAGARPGAALATGETVLMTVARTGTAEAARALLTRGADPNAQEGSRHETALMWAASWAHPETVRALLEHGADLHARSVNGFTPLLFAVRDGDVESARLLIDAGADVNETSSDGTTPLLVAAHNAREQMATALLEQGADPNLADMSKVTPLHAAVWKHVGEVGLVRRLLEYGADPNARAKRLPRALPGELPNFRSSGNLAGATPFLLAAKVADPAVMQVLAEGGADPTLATDDGTTALMLAAGTGRAEGADQNTAGEFARALDAVKLLVDFKVNVNATNRAGQTAIHSAASTSADSVIEYLASKGASIDVKDAKGETPLALTFGDVDFALTTRVSTAALLRNLGAQPVVKRQ